MGRETKLLLGMLGLLAGLFVGVLSLKLLVPRPPAGAGPDIHGQNPFAVRQQVVPPPAMGPSAADFASAPPLVANPGNPPNSSMQPPPESMPDGRPADDPQGSASLDHPPEAAPQSLFSRNDPVSGPARSSRFTAPAAEDAPSNVSALTRDPFVSPAAAIDPASAALPASAVPPARFSRERFSGADPLPDEEALPLDPPVAEPPAPSQGDRAVALDDGPRPSATALPAPDRGSPRVAIPSTAIVGSHLVAPGDSWWTVAERAYGDGRLYRGLYAWNRALDPRVSLAPGTRLDIPGRDRLAAAWPQLMPPE